MILPLSVPQIASLVLVLISLITCFVALATPNWQVVYAREIEQWIHSGLWLSCQTRPSGMYTCTYTFTNSDFNFYTNAELTNLRTPPFYSWQRNLLFIFLFAQLIAFLALVSTPLSFQAKTRQVGAIAFLALVGISLVLHCIGVVGFAFLSQMVEYRFYHVSVSGIYEKQRGYSYFIEIIGTLILVVALVFAIAHLIRLNSNTGENSHSERMLSTNNSYKDSSWEANFAMRDLPPIPQQQFQQYTRFVSNAPSINSEPYFYR